MPAALPGRGPLMEPYPSGTARLRRGHRAAAWAPSLLVAAVLACAGSAAPAGPVADRVRATGVVRVCIWPSYHGVSYRNPRTLQLTGIDIDLSRQFAADLGVRLDYVDSTHETLVEDLTEHRCDVGMAGIGMLQPRMQALGFSRPYLQSGLLAVTTKSNPVVRDWDDIDQPGVAIGVQNGASILPTVQGYFRRATVVRVPASRTRERELAAGRIDVFLTNDIYARQLVESADWARVVTPPSEVLRIPLAYPVRLGDAEWIAAVDDFVARIKGDGRLAAAARRHGLGALVVP